MFASPSKTYTFCVFVSTSPVCVFPTPVLTYPAALIPAME